MRGLAVKRGVLLPVLAVAALGGAIVFAQEPAGAFRLTPDMSFLDAFTQAGGVNDDAKDTKMILVRASTGAHQEISLKALLDSPPTRNTALEEGDIIYVPKRTLGKFGYLLQKVGPVTSFAILGSLVK